MSNSKIKQNKNKIYISQEEMNNLQNNIFDLDDIPKLNKSTFELKNYYKSHNNINNIMKEEKFNMINEIKQLNESIHISKKHIEEDLKSNSSIESLCPKDTNIYLKPYDWNKNSKEINFKKLIISIMSNEEIVNFKKNLEKLNLTGPECDEKILFNNIGSLNKYEDENEICTTTINSKSENKKEEKYLMWRKIKGDGNCYYRGVIFALIENIILTKDINYLKSIIINFMEKTNKKILKIMFNGLNLDINLVKKCFIMIYLSITSNSHDPILKAYIVFFKMINNYKDFDYGLILFFKFLLYEYIEQNKNSTYSFKFQVLIGNLLPNDCQDDEGKFNFSHFYKNYLMKFYQYAEKIILYLTPFIFWKEIIVKYINENEGMDVDIQQFEFGKNLSFVDFDKNNKIELLYKKTHYDLLYNNFYYNSYKNIFKLTLLKYIYNYQENICQICSKNNDKNSILIKLESDIIKQNKNELNIIKLNNKIIICYKCLFKEIKQNLTLLYIYFIKKIKKYFLDTFSEEISDFLPEKFTFSNKSIEVTYSHAINTLSIYRPKYNFEYIIKQIKNDICICCNANINENNNTNLKPKIVLPCKCILCSDNCIKEFYYILMSGVYIKEEFICFCNKKYSFDKCLLLIEKYNEKKFDCKEMIEYLFLKQNKNKCFLCLKENVNNKICYVIEPKFYLNHIIKHYLCNECYDTNENYLGQNIECNICKRNHIIDKISENSKNEYIKGYNIDNKIKNKNKEDNQDNEIISDNKEGNKNNNISNKNTILKKESKNKDIKNNTNNKDSNKNDINNKDSINKDNNKNDNKDNINKDNIIKDNNTCIKHNININDNINKKNIKTNNIKKDVEESDEEEEERLNKI